MEIENLETYLDKGIEILIERGPKILLAIVVLIIGLRLIKFAVKLLNKGFESRNLDATLRPFLSNLINWTLKVLLFVSVSGMVGIQNTSFVAIIGAVGLAIGFALQGTLTNFAGGFLILVFKPFKVGDLIKTNGAFGFVKEISVFVTVIETFQNETEIIPNSAITANKITNLTRVGNLRVDMPFAIRYGSDIEKAKEIVLDVLKNDKHVLQETNKAPRVAVNNLGVNGVELLALPYVKCENYWDVYWDTRQKIVEALGNANYEAPLPQRVVTMVK